MAKAKAKPKRMTMPRYYMRDDEGLDFWCFDARYIGGTKPKSVTSR